MNQIYNIRQSIRRDEMEGRTPLQHCLHMATEHNYVVWTELDNDGHLSRLLIANPTSIQMIRTWPYVVLIDTTYKTNKSKWPLCEVIGMTPTNHNFLVAFCLMRDEAAVSYSWVLQGLRDIFGSAQTPSVIVTDRDEGLSAAIRDVFPDVRHLLCTWHIGNDVENMVDKLCGGKKNQQGQIFRKSRWNPLVESATIREYEKRWEGIVSTWSVRNRRVVRYLTGTWIPLREKFVRAWTNDCLHLGNHTTSRVESQHSSFKYYLGSGNSSFDTLFKRAHAQITNQQAKIRQSLQESMTSVPRTLRQYFFRPLYRHVSLYALEQIQNEFNRMLELDDPGGRDFSQFPWPDYIPFMLPPYLFDWIDVLATFLNIAIAFYGSSNGDSLNNCLILPLRKSQAARSVNKLIHILWVNRNHFVQLFMNDDSSPLPPIHPRWKQAADNFAKDLDTNFTTRIMLWNNLRGAPPPTNNTADDAVNLDTP
ncbi:protein FAR1-RELATED SEQUENCE 2-like [Amaranthus tricolor]|uniref:protein FAR1-RELATED SEQUENCE 2-like n=1 Tax=Amaranthus tricolor TaxID=29722 RepID=UPI00258FE72C|nr:protein FAR1-RELATED SEQUENCE 2-like [Amaranthus tricolor]